MFDLETLRSRLRLDASGFTSGLNGASRALTGFSQRMASSVRGVVDFGSKLGLTVLGLRELGGVAKGAFNALFGGNVAIENVKAQLVAFTGSAEEAEKMLALIREEAAKTPFGFNEMAQAMTALIPAAKQSGMNVMDLVKQAEILAAVNPAEGLEGAAFSLREALSGDFTSIIERFNLPRQRLNELKAQGVPAMEAISIALKEMGIDYSVVSNMANTATGRWSTFIDTLNTIKDTAMRRTFELLSGALVPMQAWLDANNEKLTKFAELAGEKLANALIRLGRWLRENRDQMLRLGRTVLMVVVTGFRIFRTVLEFIGRNAKTLAPIIVGLVGSFLLFYQIIPAVQGVITTIKALRLALLTMNPWFLIIAAAVALLYLAWTRNWFGIRDKTKAVIDFLTPYVMKVVEIVRLLGDYFRDVAFNKIQPGNLEKLPKWLRPIAWIIGRLIKTVRVFVKTWQDKGFVAALKTIPTQIRAFGRAVAGFLTQITGLKSVGDLVKRQFYLLADTIKNVIELVDNVIHGRWSAAFRNLKNIALNGVKFVINGLRGSLAILVELFKKIPWGTVGQLLVQGIVLAGTFLASTALPWLLQKGVDLAGALLSGLATTFTDVVLPWLLTIPTLMFDALALGWDVLYALGNFLIDGLSKGLSFAWDWLWGWFKDLGSRLVEPFAGLFNAFFNIGWSIIAGMSAGIQSIWNTLVGWIDSIMGQFNRIPDFLKPGSPSKTATYWAESIGTGLVKGIRKTIGTVSAAMSDVAATLDVGQSPGGLAAAAPAGFGQGRAGMTTITFAPGSIVVQGVENGEQVAEQILRAIRRRTAGSA